MFPEKNARFVCSLVPGQPDGPSVKTPIPGPKTKELLNKLSTLQVRYFLFEGQILFANIW